MSEKLDMGAADFDLDEDLFNFDEIFDAADQEEEKVDLAELLAVLEPPAGSSSEAAPVEAAESAPVDEVVEESIGAGEPVREVAPVVVAAPAGAPALSKAWVRGGLAVLSAVILVNVLSLAVSWEKNREINAALKQLEGQLARSTGDLRQELFHQSTLLTTNKLPVAAANMGETISLDQALADIASGEYEGARSRLYSLLSIVDRLDPAVGRAIEADATYLLAETWRRQAEQAEEFAQ